jgi:hypothetical protein
MLSATVNAAKSAQICPNIISLKNFEMLPKLEVLVLVLASFSSFLI